MEQTTKSRPRLMRAAKRCSAHKTVQNGSLLLIGCLLVVVGMMLRG